MYLKLLKRKEGARMNKIFITMITMAFLLLPLNMSAKSEQNSTAAPAISQALVPEGTFALKLATALRLGAANDEAQGEDMLTSAGIAPKNGWIADYPVTPDIIGELQDAVAAAADSKKLPMGKEEALKALQDVAAEFGLAVLPGDSDQYAENQSQHSSTVINNYYYEEGPPVVTYYPPPWDYYYLYAWVPYPFWYSGFFFPGFFVLSDFHRVIVVHKRVVVVSNHVTDPMSKKVVRVDPVGRGTGKTSKTTDISNSRGFNSTDAKRGASSIFERSRERAVGSGKGMNVTTDKGVGERNNVSPKSGGGSGEQSLRDRSNFASTPTSRGEGSVRQSTPGGTVSRDQTGTVSRGSNERTFSQPGNIERRTEINSQRPFMGEGRSFGTPSRGSERSFSAPSMGSRGSSGDMGSNRSSGGFSAGPRGSGSSGGFGHGGSSGGQGGCKGRC